MLILRKRPKSIMKHSRFYQQCWKSPHSRYIYNITDSKMHSLCIYFIVYNKITNTLKHGEALLLNNRRVLHSRKSCKLNGGSRWFQVTQT